jgi:hypothetical protein
VQSQLASIDLLVRLDEETPSRPSTWLVHASNQQTQQHSSIIVIMPNYTRSHASTQAEPACVMFMWLGTPSMLSELYC